MSSSKPVNSCLTAFSLFFVAFTSFFTLGYNFSLMSPLIPVFKVMYNSTYTERYGTPLQEDNWMMLLTLTMSFILVGCLIGGATCKYWLMLLSRKRLLQLCHVVNIIGVLIFALVGGLTWSYEVMIIGRLILGLPIGMYVNVVVIIVAETSTRSKQRSWQSVSGIAVAVGGVVGPLFSHPKVLGTLYGWPVVIALGAIPSLAFLIASYWILETPYYFLRHSTDEEVLEVLMKLRSSNKDTCLSELQAMKNEIKESEVVGLKKMIAVKQYRNQLIAVVALSANLMLVGANHMSFYTDYVIQQAGVSNDVSGWVTIGIFGLTIFSTLIGSKLTERFGGWRMSIASSVVLIIFLTLYTVSQATAHLASDAMSIVSVVALGISIMTWYGGIYIACLALYGDLTIEPTRPTALMCANIVLWITSWLVAFVPPYLQESLGPYSMTIWLGCTIIFLIYQVIFIPDPKGKTIDEIQAKFK